MTYERFKAIFAELGITDENVVREKWKMAEIFEGPENLDEETLRWSIKTYMLPR